MSVLRSIEHRIESIVEGVFGRAFRTHVQPVELARKLAKEMDEAKSVSVSRVYVPNEYTLYLCPGDRDQFSSYEDSLLTELSDYLSEHARREGYALLSTPQVLIEEDDDLSVGEFGIATRMVQPEQPHGRRLRPDVDRRRPLPSETRIYRPPVTEAVSPSWPPSTTWPARRPRVVVGGKRHELDDATLVDRALARVRHHRRRPERLPPACGDPPGGRRVLDRRPGLDERRRRRTASASSGPSSSRTTRSSSGRSAVRFERGY